MISNVGRAVSILAGCTDESMVEKVIDKAFLPGYGGLSQNSDGEPGRYSGIIIDMSRSKIIGVWCRDWKQPERFLKP
jgi:hypothetical protein